MSHIVLNIVAALPYLRRELHLDFRSIQSVAVFDQDEMVQRLAILGLPLDSPLGVIAVELLPEPVNSAREPLTSQLGEVRIYRTSPLTPVPDICPPQKGI